MTASCSTLDLILNYLYRRLTRAAPPRTHVGAEAEGDNCIDALKAQPSLLPEVGILELLANFGPLLELSLSKCRSEVYLYRLGQ